MTRPIQRLYPLELDRSVIEENDDFPIRIATNKIIQRRDTVANEDDKEDVNDSVTTDASPHYVTRCGRTVNKNRKYVE